jgi:hypothetical protein
MIELNREALKYAQAICKEKKVTDEGEPGLAKGTKDHGYDQKSVYC